MTMHAAHPSTPLCLSMRDGGTYCRRMGASLSPHKHNLHTSPHISTHLHTSPNIPVRDAQVPLLPPFGSAGTSPSQARGPTAPHSPNASRCHPLRRGARTSSRRRTHLVCPRRFGRATAPSRTASSTRRMSPSAGRTGERRRARRAYALYDQVELSNGWRGASCAWD